MTLRGGRATGSSNPADLSPCVVGRPMVRALIYEASGLASWRYSNSRFDTRLSDTRWDGDTSYPHSTGCDGNASKVSPPTASCGCAQPCGL